MKKADKAKRKIPTTATDVPATNGMLYGVRDELKSNVRSLEHKMNARFETVESKIDSVHTEVHRIGVLVEEQNAKNNIVLEALTNLFHRQDRLEGDFEGFRKGFNLTK